MTGAVGAGKSALQQTVAEKCEGSDTPAFSFFFSATDSTRNTLKAVVPTLAYQLGRGRDHSRLRMLIAETVDREHLIFSQSLKAQMKTLIVDPIKQCRPEDVVGVPSVLLIDGLDACEEEGRQTELLEALVECLLVDELPFRVFIASRPERPIRSALNRLHHLIYHIRLSDQYDATEDIRKYLLGNLQGLGLRLTEDDIDVLVRAASGQFIYAAMVVKYISEPRCPHKRRLAVVLKSTPNVDQSDQPLEALDTLYTKILSTAKSKYEAANRATGHDFLLLFRIYQANATSDLDFGTSASIPANTLTALLNLDDGAEETLVSDLRSLVTFENQKESGDVYLRLYHKSFADFLNDKRRAGDLFVPISDVRAHIATCRLKNIAELDFLPHVSNRVRQSDFTDRVPTF
jgi:hypothetical protein